LTGVEDYEVHDTGYNLSCTKMDFFKSNHHILATTIFVLSIVVAHIFSTDGYDWTQNTISELGAQGYGRKLIMQVGFLAFGITLALGILLSGLSWRTAPILMYGLCVALTGVFCTKPFVQIDTYSGTESTLHSALAQVAGFAFSIGILTQLFFTPETNTKWIHLAFFVLVIGLSATFGLLENHQGIVQRLLYAASFVWLIGYYKP
jgi:hypothetical protein